MMMEEEIWRMLEEGVAKAKVILDGYPVNAVFSSEEYIKYYDCVYHLSCYPLDCQAKLLAKFKETLEGSIVSKVLPSVMDKDGAPLIEEFLRLWTNYKIMTKCLGGFFQYLDRQTMQQETPLSNISYRSFLEMVHTVLHKRLTDATLFLITQDRIGVPIDRRLLQGISKFYVEVGEQVDTPNYVMFEDAVLADAANYYSNIASEWYLWHSSINYVLKVELCLLEEKTRASEFLQPSSTEKLLQVMHWQMLEQYAEKLAEKQNAEKMNSMGYQDIISRCSSMRLG